MVSTSNAHWTGGPKDGKGTLNTKSATLRDTPYDFRNRFEGGTGTTPEEMIAAAHAGCFAMALSGQLGERGITAEAIDAKADVTLDFVDGAPTVTKSHLTLKLTAPGADKAAAEEAIHAAKAGCPISRLLKAEVTLDFEIA